MVHRTARPYWASLAALVLWLAPGRVQAGCNTIPPAARTFGSTRGFVDRTMAGPRQRVSVTLRPACLPNPLPPGDRDHFESTDKVNIRFGAGGSLPMDFPGANPTVDTLDNRVLRFQVPNTQDPTWRKNGVAGLVTITVTDKTGTLTLATIDTLYQPTDGCDQVPEPLFQHFVVLPEANNFDVQQTDDDLVLMTLDGGEDILIPFLHKHVPTSTKGPVAHLERGFGLFAAVAANPAVKIGQVLANAKAGGARDGDLVQVFTEQGYPLPPLLSVDTTGALFGTADADVSVVRVARRGGLYDLSDQATDVKDDGGVTHPGLGPIVIQNVSGGTRKFRVFRCPHPTLLSGLKPAREVVALTTDEALPGVGNQNGANGTLDLVPEVLARVQGGKKCPMSTRTAVAAAMTGVASRPLLDAQSGLTAFLRSDDVLRAFDSSGTDLTASIPDSQLAATEEPVVNGASLVVAAPFVFFRQPGSGTPQLKVLDTRTSPPTVRSPGISAQVVVVDPEHHTAAVRTGGVAQAQFYDGDSAQSVSLGFPVDQLALSDHLVAMTVAETVIGAPTNGDSDTTDKILMVAAVTPPTPPTPTSLGVAADAVQITIAGTDKWVVFTTLESAEGPTGLDCQATVPPGGCDLNGDQDADDRILRAYNSAKNQTIEIGQAEDFVASGPLIAYRATEIPLPLGITPPVMTVYDLAKQRWIRLNVPAVPCTEAGYEWMHPYAVRDRNVYFVTEEPSGRRVLETFDVDTLGLQVIVASASPLPPVSVVSLTGAPLIRVQGKEDQPFTLLGDRDGDGMFDAFDRCIDTPDHSNFDDDLDGLGTACDDNLCTAFVVPATSPSGDEAARARRTLLVAEGVRYVTTRLQATTRCLVRLTASGHAEAVEGDPTEQCRGYFVGSSEVDPLDARTGEVVAGARERFFKQLDSRRSLGIERAEAAGIFDHFAEAAIAISHAAFGDGAHRLPSSSQCPQALDKAITKDAHLVLAALQDFLATPPARDVMVTHPGDALDLGAGGKLPAPVPIDGCDQASLRDLDACGADGAGVAKCVRCTVLRRMVDALMSTALPATPRAP